jgi:uncharacterized protein
MRIRILTMAAAMMMLTAPSIILAAPPLNPNTRTLEVSGNGEAQAPPDLATLQVAIETHAPTAAEAAGSNAALAQKVTDALKEKLGDKGAMWTGGYSLSPDYREIHSGGKPTIVGYNADNSITVETGALDLVGPMIDAAIAAGANRVNSLDYSLRDNSKSRSAAITKASKDAVVQAQALASALNVKLGPILTASTVSEMIRPIPMMRASFSAMAAAPPTPVSAGQVTVPATVSLTYEIQ